MDDNILVAHAQSQPQLGQPTAYFDVAMEPHILHERHIQHHANVNDPVPPPDGQRPFQVWNEWIRRHGRLEAPPGAACIQRVLPIRRVQGKLRHECWGAMRVHPPMEVLCSGCEKHR